MDRIWESTPEGTIFWIVALAILITVGSLVLAKIRPKPVQKERTVRESLTKFQEMHAKGDLSDEEFRTIKTTLASQLDSELRENGGKG